MLEDERNNATRPTFLKTPESNDTRNFSQALAPMRDPPEKLSLNLLGSRSPRCTPDFLVDPPLCKSPEQTSQARKNPRGPRPNNEDTASYGIRICGSPLPGFLLDLPDANVPDKLPGTDSANCCSGIPGIPGSTGEGPSFFIETLRVHLRGDPSLEEEKTVPRKEC